MLVSLSPLCFADLQFDDDSGSDLDDASLPFPKPLARSLFVVDDFDPSTFLASLSNRYQTLDDLGNELRGLSQSLSKELLDLVNDNCNDYLLLGTTLQGGQDRVEEVRLSLLSCQRELKLLSEAVDSRRTKAAALIEHRKKVAAETQLGRNLLDLEQLLQDLEAALLLESVSEPEFDESDPLTRVSGQVEVFLSVMLLTRRLSAHPFVVAQQARIAKIKSTLVLDLQAAAQTDPDRINQLLQAIDSSSVSTSS